MSCTENADCLCGCCTGISIETPQDEFNVPGLPDIAYRAGTWATFKESMLARLSSSSYRALSGLKTRANDDFSIALLDASSVMLDILTFYQERLANESYLRTAVQLQSLTELARLIAYQPAPGVGSSAYLAFTLQAAPGAPTDPTTTTITIPKGTQVQSVPAQGQIPQNFETSSDILAKADWNALSVQTGLHWIPAAGDVGLYLEGTATQLQPGDAILVVGDERLLEPGHETNQQWDLRIVTTVDADTKKNRTRVTWGEGLGSKSGSVAPANQNPKFFALRQRASLFGYNAINPKMLTAKTQARLGGLISSGEWAFSSPGGGLMDLDAVYSKLAVGGWLAVISPDGSSSRSPSGLITLHQINSVTSISRSDYGISARVTRVAVDNASDLSSNVRNASVLTQSEQLAAAERPLDHPLYGSSIDLKGVRLDLAAVRAVAIYGKSQKLKVNPGVSLLVFHPDDASGDLPLNPGDIVTILAPANLPPAKDGIIPDWTTSSDTQDLRVLDASGRTGVVSDAAVSNFTLVPASSKDPVIQEFALVSSISLVADPDPQYPHTRINLSSELLNCYDRTATFVNANVGLATQGMSVSEILGGGSSRTPNQKFSLKQAPLTFVQSPTATGRLSTLEVRANQVAWKETASLYQQPPSAAVFTTLNQPGGNTEILLGDGVEGATLPTGQNNIQANYRIGSGLAGNVRASSITTLMDRPLGVSGVDNPQAATGGQDPQSVDDIRSNAPLTVLTLGRVVSITDYQNFSQSFAGIAKAYAIWIPSGPGRGVFITVAAAGGSALPSGSDTLTKLITALHDHGNPLIPIHVGSFLETLFSFRADIQYDPAYDAKAVKQAILDKLRQSYSFEARSFGQGVSSDEIEAFIQGIAGVVACNVKELTLGKTSKAGDLGSTGWSTYAYQQWIIQGVNPNRPKSSSLTRICAYLPIARLDKLPDPAEIIVLDPNPKNVVLGVMA